MCKVAILGLMGCKNNEYIWKKQKKLYKNHIYPPIF